MALSDLSEDNPSGRANAEMKAYRGCLPACKYYEAFARSLSTTPARYVLQQKEGKNPWLGGVNSHSKLAILVQF
jgi:hypothetical protein